MASQRAIYPLCASMSLYSEKYLIRRPVRPSGISGDIPSVCYLPRVTVLRAARNGVTRGASQCYTWHVTMLRVTRNAAAGFFLYFIPLAAKYIPPFAAMRRS